MVNQIGLCRLEQGISLDTLGVTTMSYIDGIFITRGCIHVAFVCIGYTYYR